MESRPAQYQDLLSHEFEVRQNHNPAYSLRAYARDLGISVSSLSRILNRQQDLSLKKAKDIARVLGLSPSETDYFCTLIRLAHARTDRTKEQMIFQLRSQDMSGTEMSLEYFKTISDWHYFAILELTRLKGFKSDPKWIAGRLGLSETVVRDSIQRLKKLELIEEDRNGKLSKTYDFKATPSGIPSRALKSHHQQILRKAESALFDRELEETDFSSIAFSLCDEDLKWAKEEMKKFRRALTKRLAKNPKRNRLYELSMQLFPLEQIQEKEKS